MESGPGGPRLMPAAGRNMNEISMEEYKDELLNHFSNAVKQVQMEQISKQEGCEYKNTEVLITNESPAGRILCTSLDMIFSHGLKHRESGYWEAVRYFCRNDVIYRVGRLKRVKTNVGRGRAWIFIALNEKELEGYLHSFQMDLSQMYKYYYRSAMLCSSQISVMQTLISGLDHISFKLNPDVIYLDFKITGSSSSAVTSSKSDTYRKTSQPHCQSTFDLNRGSSVHIDASTVTDMATRVKGFLSRESMSERDTIKNGRTLVAVNNHCKAEYDRKTVTKCPDCKSPSELVCLCVKESSEAQTSSAPQNSDVRMLEYLFNENEASRSDTPDDFVSTSTVRVNPFNKLSGEDDIEVSAGANYRRCNSVVPVLDAPLEVIHKKKTRKKHRRNDTSTSKGVAGFQRRKREVDLISTAGSSNSWGSMSSDIPLSDPLIDFDPCIDRMESVTNACGSDDNTEVVQGVNNDKRHTDALETCNNELTQTFLPNQHESVSSQGSNITISDSLELTENCDDIGRVKSSSKNIISVSNPVSEQLQSTVNGERDINLVGNTLTLGDENNSSQGQTNLVGESFIEERDVTMTTEVKEQNLPVAEMSDIQNEDVIEGVIEGGADEVSVLSDAFQTDISSEEMSEKINSDAANVTISAYPASKNNNFYTTSSGNIVKEDRKHFASKMRGMRRYRSESEDLLNDLTRKEVERLRAEIKNKLKPSQDRLEKVQKSMAVKTLYQEGSGSFRHDSAFMLDGDKDSEASFSSRPLFDNSSDENQSVVSQDTDIRAGDDAMAFMKDESFLLDDSILSSLDRPGLTSSRISTPGSYSESETPHSAVANIDNTLRLYLMLEILNEENEEIIKLFHVSTGHAEGSWTPLYLLFSDSFVYFLRSGDGNCPYQSEEIVSYEDLDYISVGSNSQTMQFVFYKSKAKISNSKKPMRRKVRTKLTIDTADKDLTNLVISNLSKALVSFTRQQSVIKVCPPIFHDAKEHQISLRKYISAEGLTGDIQLYQLVHWEDPEFVTGASMSKISLEGRLKYRAHSFWGSTWRPAYFVLNGGVLYQYENKESEKPEISYQLGQNNCIGCKRFRSDPTSTPGLVFEITFRNDKKLTLCGFSDLEVTEWLQCLCMIVSLDQACMLDKEAQSDGVVMNILNRDALVPCSLIIVDEHILLCHEDQHTGFCRTLAKSHTSNISEINIDKKVSYVCEVTIVMPSELMLSSKWGIFFSGVSSQEDFLSVMNNNSKAPTINDVGSESSLAHCLEARTLLDNRWTRTDNLLRGRSGGVEAYTFV